LLSVQTSPFCAPSSAVADAWQRVTAAFVAGLAAPDFLVEIDAIAIVPQE
jgi:enamine deaminase RidA (YjgF/YER057c/UK114 family)